MPDRRHEFALVDLDGHIFEDTNLPNAARGGEVFGHMVNLKKGHIYS
jgi:hypothetical protein